MCVFVPVLLFSHPSSGNLPILSPVDVYVCFVRAHLAIDDTRFTCTMSHSMHDSLLHAHRTHKKGACRVRS